MAKGVAKDAINNSGTGSNQATQLYGDAGNLYGPLSAEYQQEATNPQGYGPTTMAKMDTANKQSAGGSQAAAVGQGALRAARTRNAGSADAAIADSTRTAGQQLSDATLHTSLANANLKNQQQQQGLQGESNLYATNLGAAGNALGLSNNALGIANEADANNPWMKLLQQGMQSGGQVAASGFGNGGAWS